MPVKIKKINRFVGETKHKIMQNIIQELTHYSLIHFNIYFFLDENLIAKFHLFIKKLFSFL